LEATPDENPTATAIKMTRTTVTALLMTPFLSPGSPRCYEGSTGTGDIALVLGCDDASNPTAYCGLV